MGRRKTSAKVIASGIRHTHAVVAGEWACDVLPLIATASAIESDVWRARGSTEQDQSAWIEGLRRTFGSLPPERFPLLTTLTDELTSGDGDERFHFAIEAFLDGMVARAQRS